MSTRTLNAILKKLDGLEPAELKHLAREAERLAYRIEKSAADHAREVATTLIRGCRPDHWLVLTAGLTAGVWWWQGKGRAQVRGVDLPPGTTLRVTYRQPRAKRLWLEYDGGHLGLDLRHIVQARPALYGNRLQAEVARQSGRAAAAAQKS